MVTNLADIIAPMSSDDFIRDYWAQSFAHFHGKPGRFEGLYSWDQLNRVLEEHRIFPSQLRLSRNGKSLDPTQYLYGPGDYRLRPAQFLKHLEQGATLVLNFAEETSRPLRDLAVAIEEVFRSGVLVNLYAGWKTDPGFTVHFDDQDTFILQVYGRKQWRVWAPTRMHPLRPDIEAAPQPQGAPYWEGILNDGEVLFMPRGWWHVAYPLDEPCMHLTVSVLSHTGVDFLKWVADTLRTSEVVRQNLPVTGNAGEQDDYLMRLRGHVEQLLVPGVLENYLRNSEFKKLQRPVFNLPAFDNNAEAMISGRALAQK